MRLAKEVERYHRLEGWFVEQLLSHEGREVSESMMSHWRGQYRQRSGLNERPTMSANEARKVRRRYLNFD